MGAGRSDRGPAGRSPSGGPLHLHRRRHLLPERLPDPRGRDRGRAASAGGISVRTVRRPGGALAHRARPPLDPRPAQRAPLPVSFKQPLPLARQRRPPGRVPDVPPGLHPGGAAGARDRDPPVRLRGVRGRRPVAPKPDRTRPPGPVGSSASHLSIRFAGSASLYRPDRGRPFGAGESRAVRGSRTGPSCLVGAGIRLRGRSVRSGRLGPARHLGFLGPGGGPVGRPDPRGHFGRRRTPGLGPDRRGPPAGRGLFAPGQRRGRDRSVRPRSPVRAPGLPTRIGGAWPVRAVAGHGGPVVAARRRSPPDSGPDHDVGRHLRVSGLSGPDG